MARKKSTPPPAPAKPTGYYAEENITWDQPDPSALYFVASNLDEPDEAYVVKKPFSKGQPRWFWRASDGALIEREYLSPGLVETQFTAQAKAIQWLNMRRKVNDKEQLQDITPETVQHIFSQAAAPSAVADHISTKPTPAEVKTALGYTVDQSHVDANGVTVVDKATITEVSTIPATAAPADDKPFSAYFPRHRDAFGNEIPDDTPHPDDDQPLSATVDPSLDDSKDEIIDPQPTRRGRRK